MKNVEIPQILMPIEKANLPEAKIQAQELANVYKGITFYIIYNSVKSKYYIDRSNKITVLWEREVCKFYTPIK